MAGSRYTNQGGGSGPHSSINVGNTPVSRTRSNEHSIGVFDSSPTPDRLHDAPPTSAPPSARVPLADLEGGPHAPRQLPPMRIATPAVSRSCSRESAMKNNEVYLSVPIGVGISQSGSRSPTSASVRTSLYGGDRPQPHVRLRLKLSTGQMAMMGVLLVLISGALLLHSSMLHQQAAHSIDAMQVAGKEGG